MYSLYLTKIEDLGKSAPSFANFLLRKLRATHQWFLPLKSHRIVGPRVCLQLKGVTMRSFTSVRARTFLCLFGLTICALPRPLRAAVEARPLMFKRLLVTSVEDDLISVDKTERLRVLGETADGKKIAFPEKVRWTSANANAEVNDLGFVTGKAAGPAVINVEAASDPSLRGSLVTTVAKDPVQIYFQAPRNWSKAHVWYWYLDGEAEPSGLDRNGNPLNAITSVGQGSFPGPQMKPVEGLPGWFSAALPRYDDTAQYPNRRLVKQSIRLLFSNPDNGEKTRDFLHNDGCFYAYNRYLRGNVIDGRWDSPSNCPAFPKKLRAIAEGRGGPVWSDRGFVNLIAQGTQNAVSRYTFDGSAAGRSSGASFPKNGEALILDKQFDAEDQTLLCLYLQDASSGKSNDECYSFYRTEPGAERALSSLGASYKEGSTTFSIWSPDRNSVELWLDGRVLPMGYIGDAIQQPGVWAVTVPGNHYLKRYQFLIDDVPVRDPYAVMVEPGTDYAIVMDPSRIQPEGGWAPTPPLKQREDAVVYELSVRDFTIAPNSGVSPELRGTFLGLVEPGTYLNKGQSGANASIKTGIEHLKELGVTHVQLMPVYDYATCSAQDVRNSPNCYNWGYDPENFNVPEERYATRTKDYEGRIREFQTMVNELHKAGIRVIMDVVYNHTWVRPWREADEGEKYFGDITGSYFLFDERGIGYQLTGTGNTVDPKNPQVYKYIQDSLDYWVKTYNIDGYRFDVAGVFDYQEITGWMTHLYKKFPEKKLLAYGEPYTALPDPDGKHFRLFNISKMENADGKAEFGGFNFAYREAIKGSNDNGNGGGFAFNDSYNANAIINGLRGSLGYDDVYQSAFASDPVQTINYTSSHDNLNLFDKISAWASLQPYQVSLDYRKRIQVFANAIVLMSQGIPFLHSGEEFLRTKGSIPDSYQAGDNFNRIDWSRKAQYQDVADAYAQLVSARRRFAGLRLGSREEIESNLQVRSIGNGCFEVHVNGNGSERAELLILLNSGADRNYSLPPGEWTLALEQSRRTQERKVSGQILASGTAVTLLYRQ